MLDGVEGTVDGDSLLPAPVAFAGPANANTLDQMPTLRTQGQLLLRRARAGIEGVAPRASPFYAIRSLCPMLPV